MNPCYPIKQDLFHIGLWLGPVCNPFGLVPFEGTKLPQNLVQNCQNIAKYNATRNNLEYTAPKHWSKYTIIASM